MYEVGKAGVKKLDTGVIIVVGSPEWSTYKSWVAEGNEPTLANEQPYTLPSKDSKIAELNSACNTEILAGFTSSTLGTTNTYDFDYEAQTNLGGMLNAITAGIITVEPIKWKASGVPKDHTFVQFKKLFADGLVHKDTCIQKYWTLKAQVQAATTQAEVDAIVW